jgi:hypothetical protein
MGPTPPAVVALARTIRGARAAVAKAAAAGAAVITEVVDVAVEVVATAMLVPAVVLEACETVLVPEAALVAPDVLLPELPVDVPVLVLVTVVLPVAAAPVGVVVTDAVVLPEDPPPQAANDMVQASVITVNFVVAKVRTADNMISGAGSLR